MYRGNLTMRFALISLLALVAVVSSARDILYDDVASSRYANKAIWKPDGSQFATWDELGGIHYVYVWQVSDGSRLFLLNTAMQIDAATGEIFYEYIKFVADVYWSDAGETITTVVHTVNPYLRVRQQLWSANTGELLASYVISTGSFHGRGLELHQVIKKGALVASWTQHRLSYIDIDPGSASVGRELAAIAFGDLSLHRWRDVHWKADNSRALLTLHDKRDDYCPECAAYYRLVDIDPYSDTFAETLWQLEVIRFTLGDTSWYSDSDILAIHRAGAIEVWDLNPLSERFGEQILHVEREFEFFHNLLFDVKNQRVIVVEQNNLEFIEGAHPDAGPQCIDERCEYYISVWDLDGESPTFGERLATIVHMYSYDGYRSRVAFNESETQIHIHVVNIIRTEDDFHFEYELFSYDLLSFVATDARDIVPKPDPYAPLDKVPQVDLSHLEDASNENLPVKFLPIALNHDGSMLLTKKFAGKDVFDVTMSIVVIDMLTGEQHLPVQDGAQDSPANVEGNTQ